MRKPRDNRASQNRSPWRRASVLVAPQLGPSLRTVPQRPDSEPGEARMTIPVFDPPIPPAVGAKIKREVKLLRADFGDGFSQIARDGTNHIRKSYDLEWPVLTEAQADQIVDFLEARGGDEMFWYSLGNKPAIKMTCDQWEEAQNSGGHFSVTATFKQSFSLA
jgi:phage-related protein